MIQIERQSPYRSPQPQGSLAQMRSQLQQAKEVIYNQLARKNSDKSGIQQAIDLINKYEQINETLHQLNQAQLRISSKQKQKLVKQSLDETSTHKDDTAMLVQKQKERQEKYQSQNNQLIGFIQLVGYHTATVREMEIEIKQHRLLQNSVDNLRQVYDELKKQQESDTMHRKLGLTSEKDNNEYILNQIHRDSQQQLTHLQLKLEALQAKLRHADAASKILTDQYHKVLEEFNRQKIKATLLTQPAKPRPKQKKQSKSKSKRGKGEQGMVGRIGEVQGIEAECLLMPARYGWQLGAGVLLAFASLCVLLQWLSR